MMTELRFGPDGYLDLSDLPDGDPDTVLPADELAALHDALVEAHPDVDDDVWDGLVHAAVADDGHDDLLAVAVPGADAGPFALDPWAGDDHHDDGLLVDADHDHDGLGPDLPDGPGHDDLLHHHDDDLLGGPADHHDDDGDPLDGGDHAAVWDTAGGLDDTYHLDLDLDLAPHDGDHDAPDGDDAFTPDEDEHYDF